MKSAMQILSSKVFRKQLIGFCLAVLPLYTILIVSIVYGSHVITREVQNSNKDKILYFMKSFETELNNINQMLIVFNNDPDLNNYAVNLDQEYSYDRAALFQSLMSKMNLLYYSNDRIYDVFMLIPQKQQQVSYKKGISEIPPGRNGLLEPAVNAAQRLTLHMDDDHITYSIRFPDVSFDRRTSNYVIGVEISESSMIDMLKKNQMDLYSHVFLIENDSKRLVGEKTMSAEDREVYGQYRAVLDGQSNTSLSRMDIKGKKVLLQSAASENGQFTLVSYVFEGDVLGALATFRLLVIFLIACSVVIFIAFSWLTYRQIHTPLHLLLKGMKRVETGNYDSRFAYRKKDEFGYVHLQFNNMVLQIKNLVEEVLQNRILVQQAQLNLLQSQINPHFLYNCFYIGYRMAKDGEQENVAQLCKYLGDYFRYTTQNQRADATLQEEIATMDTYLQIQKYRFAHRLAYRIAVDGRVRQDISIPRLIIQPVVENAIVHGIEKTSYAGEIGISVALLSDRLTIRIEDNGLGLDEMRLARLQAAIKATHNDSGHTGLWNVHWRLRYRYGEQAGLSVMNRPGGGLCVLLTIPADNLSLPGGQA